MTTLFSSGARLTLTLTLALVAGLAACDLTVSDPNATTEEDAFTTRAGLLASSVGLQLQYNAVAYDNLVLTTGVTSREIAIDNTFVNLIELEQGGAGLDDTNQNVAGIFREMYQVLATTEDLIAGAQATPLEPELRSGIVALGQFYQAAALGALAIAFTDVALETDPAGQAQYSSRQDALERAAALLDEAESGLTATPPSAAFNAILPDGFDLLNSVRAYRARFELLAGDYAAAIDAADRVDPSATSVFAYSTDVGNQLFIAFSPTQGTPSYAVRDNLGLASVEAGDGRIAALTVPNADTSTPNGLPIEAAGGYLNAGLAGSLPVYIPDEMALIRAEAYVRLDQLATAVDEINAVRTDDDDPFGLAADLPPYSGPVTAAALLDEIYYNRATELYLQGLRLEDQRRLGQGDPMPTDIFSRTRNFYPFPQQERLANPNTPANPPI